MNLSERQKEKVIERLRHWVSQMADEITIHTYPANVVYQEEVSGHPMTKTEFVKPLLVPTRRSKVSDALPLMQLCLGTGILNAGTVERFAKRLIHRVQIISVLPTDRLSAVNYYPVTLDTWSAGFVSLIEKAIEDEVSDEPVEPRQ
jgi:hypothetical protein